MHASEVQTSAAKCSMCGTQLVHVDRVSNKKGTVEYSCAMHPGMHAEKGGKCPVCGMEVTEAKTETSSRKN